VIDRKRARRTYLQVIVEGWKDEEYGVKRKHKQLPMKDIFQSVEHVACFSFNVFFLNFVHEV
jgi:hypothetical protein